MLVRSAKSYQKLWRNVRAIRHARDFYLVRNHERKRERKRKRGNNNLSTPWKWRCSLLRQTKNWGRSLVEMLLEIGANVHNNDLNCNRLNRSPADHLLARGSAGRDRALARLESTDFIQLKWLAKSNNIRMLLEEVDLSFSYQHRPLSSIFLNLRFILNTSSY